jgi:CheY-like chemotaxis protein
MTAPTATSATTATSASSEGLQQPDAARLARDAQDKALVAYRAAVTDEVRLCETIEIPRLFSLVLLDVRITAADQSCRHADQLEGIKLLSELRLRFPFAPVIMLTSSDRATTVQVSRAHGAQFYWLKGKRSARDLVRSMLACDEPSRVHALWARLQALRAATRIVVTRHAAGKQPVKFGLPSKEPTRTFILDELDAVLNLLFLASAPMAPASPLRQRVAAKAILDLCRIQEARLFGLGQEHPAWSSVRDRKEDGLRQGRSRLAHATESPASQDDLWPEALKRAESTIELLEAPLHPVGHKAGVET